MKKAKYAAIDIGSNAVRLLISTVFYDENNVDFRKTALIRFPIRLGEDVFKKGKISKEKSERILHAMGSYALAIKAYGIDHYYACATSAVRNASNGKDIVKKVKDKTGIEINVIDGKTEAKFIAETDFTAIMKDDENYLYVDVGGGSTEYSFYSKGKLIESNSFRIGTVRLLHGLVQDKTWKEAEKWVKKTTKGYDNITLVGSGGNINTIFKASKTTSKFPMSKTYLEDYTALLKSKTYEERIIDLKLKEDRADVIVPATDIFLRTMNWSRSEGILVPKVGLADGIVRVLHKKYSNASLL